MSRSRVLSVLLPVALLAFGGCATSSTSAPASLHHQLVTLTLEPGKQMLLAGPPATGGMRSGRVLLLPGEEMHRHSTRGNEEILVLLEGKARVIVGTEPVSVEVGQILYIPPQTEHEVHNDGPGQLRYVFTVAPAQESRLQ